MSGGSRRTRSPTRRDMSLCRAPPCAAGLPAASIQRRLRLESALSPSFEYLRPEARVLATLRRHYQIKLETIRRAVRYMEKRFQDQHALINPGMRTDGVDLFLEQFGGLEGVSREGQLAIKDILESSL